MRVLLSILIFPLVVACSTMSPSPAPSPSTSVAETAATDIGGRWIGHWTGAGLFGSYREDDVTVDLVQRGDAAVGRLVLQGTTAAESVPTVIRRGGQWGNQVVARVEPGTVTLRHYLDGRLFTVDLKLSEDGQRMAGWVRDAHPRVGLALSRAPHKVAREAPAPAPPAATPPPAPQPQVAMTPPPPEPEPKAAEAPAERPKQDEFRAVQELTTIGFDFDKSELRPDARDTLTTHAGWLKEHADAAVLIEGHCDERGTSEYNVALGERRANAVRDYLSQNGVASERLSTVSYGKERLACAADTKECHDTNRRAEFRVKSR